MVLDIGSADASDQHHHHAQDDREREDATALAA